MKRYQLTLDGQVFDVLLLSDPHQDQVQVEVNGVAFTAHVKTLPAAPEAGPKMAHRAGPSIPAEAPVAARLPGVQMAATTGNAVTAPLPGVIKSVAVRNGQHVSSGEVLLVIEAMKMDNVIRAQQDGVVETVLVSEGRQVAYGERLLEYHRPGGA